MVGNFKVDVKTVYDAPGTCTMFRTATVSCPMLQYGCNANVMLTITKLSCFMLASIKMQCKFAFTSIYVANCDGYYHIYDF